jgi:hypothetical protein
MRGGGVDARAGQSLDWAAQGDPFRERIGPAGAILRGASSIRTADQPNPADCGGKGKPGQALPSLPRAGREVGPSPRCKIVPRTLPLGEVLRPGSICATLHSPHLLYPPQWRNVPGLCITPQPLVRSRRPDLIAPRTLGATV